MTGFDLSNQPQQELESPPISDALRQILDMCASMKRLRAGHALPLQTLLHQGIQRGLNGPDIHDAVVEGAGLGWLEKDNREVYLLTEEGASAIRRGGHSFSTIDAATT